MAFRTVVGPWVQVVLLVLGICLGGACSAMSLMSENLGPSTPIPPTVAGQQLSFAGWFHVIWNGGPQYVLIDDQGRWTRLLLDEVLTRPFGGPLAFNRKRVKIVGEKVSAPPGAVRVLSIGFE